MDDITSPRQAEARLYVEDRQKDHDLLISWKVAGTTGLERATSDVTGRRSNQLNYVPAVGETGRQFYSSIHVVESST